MAKQDQFDRGGSLEAFPPPRLVAFDLDGVIYRGKLLLPSVPEALADVLGRGLALRYVTNNATLHREAVADRLLALGLPAGPEMVLSSAFAAATWLRGRLPAGAKVLVVGEEGLLRELREAGFAAAHVLDEDGRSPAVMGGPAVPEAVVVGLDRSFTFRSLARAQAALLAGALFVATNPDRTFPAEGQILPGAGSLVAAVQAAAGRQPNVIGKPCQGLAEALALSTGVPAAETLFVGDRLDTDVAFGVEAGMQTVLVLTGVTTREELQDAPVAAHHVLETLAQFPALLDRLGVGKA